MSLSNNFPTTPPSLNLDFANVKALDPRVTFTRSTTATYYDGVTVAMAEQNLLQYSQEFDNAYWTKTNVTITANAIAAPDGTTTADLMLETTANGGHSAGISSALASAAYTVSFYAKYYSRQWVRVDLTGTGASISYFDVQNGATGNTPAGTTSSITSVGNGWYRCVVNFTGAAWPYIGLASANGTVVYTGVVTEGAYFWGAQLEQRSSVTAYTATTTQPITNYIPVLQTAASGIPRFDHNPTTGESLGFLIEESRTNSQTYSADFSNAAWSKLEVSVNSNTIIAPDGTLTADKLVANTNTNYHLAIGSTVSASGSYTMSVYAKAGEYTRMGVRESNITGNGILFDLSAGTVISTVNATATITPVGNGWYRCTATITWGTNYAMGIVVAQNSDTSLLPVFTGNGFNGIYIWGAQLEAGAFPTSYIATTTAAATRNADDASMTGTNFSSWYDAGEGTLFAEFNASTGVSYCAPTSLYTDANNEITIVGGTPGVGAVGFVVITGGSVQANPGTRALGQKIAGAYKLNDFAVSTNGAAAATDTSGTVPSISTLGLGNSYSSSYLNGHLRRVAYYPARLTNAQLQALTS